MNQSTYKTIFSLSVFHSYFDNNAISDLQFTPTQNTHYVINKNRLKLNLTGSRLELYVSTDESIETFLDQIGVAYDIQSFEFDIYSPDPDFINYTDLSMDWNGFAALSNSSNLNQIVLEDLALHTGSMKGHHPGRLGQLHIRIEDITSVLQAGTSAHFDLMFQARSTQWWYYFINQSLISYDKLSIISQAGIQFNDAVEVVLKNGQKATLITSQILIPLSQKSKLKLDLIDTGTGTKTVISGLPIAGPSNISMLEEDGQEVFVTQVYVYL